MGAFTSTNPEGQAALSAFLDTLQGFGWIANQTARIDVRWMGDDVERGKTYAAELVALAPDVLFCSSSLATVLLSRSTRTIPIVFAQVADPVGNGWVKSLARPGGNMTGFSNVELQIGGKWLEILKEMAPRFSRVAVLLYPEVPGYVNMLRAVEVAGLPLSVKVNAADVHNVSEIQHAITSLASLSDGGLVVLPGPITNGNYGLIADDIACPRSIRTAFTSRLVAVWFRMALIRLIGTARRLHTSLVY